MIEEKLKIQCGLCKTPLVIKKIDVGTRFKFELLCPYCNYYKAWFEEKPVKKGKKK